MLFTYQKLKVKRFLRSFCCIAFFNASSLLIAFAQDRDILAYLPDTCEFVGWDQEDSVRVFAGEELFTLIDGGADIYFEYGFRQVAAAKYRNNLENSIKLEIFEMSDASAAYGMYSLNAGTHGKKVHIGNEGMLYDYHLMFWKNVFLVFLTGADTTDETKSGIMAMAASIDQRLGAPGEKPTLAACLPSDGLRSCAFIRGNLGLSSFYTFDTKNIFRMKEGIIGIYPAHQLYLFQYNSGSETKERYADVQSIFKSGSRYSDFKEYGRYSTMTDKKGNRLCFTYFDNLIVAAICQSKNDAKTICDDVINSLRD